MDNMDLKPNSHKYREKQKEALEKKKIESVVKGGVKTRSNGVRKFTETFISEDAKNIKTYVIHDVVVPTIKKMLVTSLDMFLNGGRSNYDNRSSSSKVSYRRYYDDPRDSRPRESERPRSRFDYDDIIFDHRADAEAVLDSMTDALEEYKVVTVQDLYEFAELSAPFTSNKYGWTNLSKAYVTSLMGGGYTIKLPKAMPID